MRRKIIYYGAKSIVYIAISFAIFFPVYFLSREVVSYVTLIDGCAFTSFALLAFLVLEIAYAHGFLDIIFYGFSVFTTMFTTSMNRKYKDVSEYREIKKESRNAKSFDFLIPLILAFIYFIIGLIVYLVK